MHVVVQFPAGNGTDVIARCIAAKLQRRFGQPFVIENKAGANDIIAAQAVADAEPDGYTIFTSSLSTQATNVSLYKSLPYDAQRDFAPILGIVTNTLILTSRLTCQRGDAAALTRRACQLVKQARSVQYYRSVKDPQLESRTRMREIARTRVRYVALHRA